MTRVDRLQSQRQIHIRETSREGARNSRPRGSTKGQSGAESQVKALGTQILMRKTNR